MAENRRYGTNGAAAYDVYSNVYRYPNGTENYYDGSAVRQPQRQGLPEERTLPERRQRVKVKTAVAPFTLFGMAAAALMLVLVIFGYVQLFEATSRVSKLESQLQSLQEEQLLLQSKYEGKIDLAGIEEQAETLGLKKPSQEQIVYVNLAGTDQAEIYKTEKSSILSEIIGAVEQSISDLIAYLHPAAA